MNSRSSHSTPAVVLAGCCLAVLVAPAAGTGREPDPDRSVVAETGLPLGRLEIEILEEGTSRTLPARLFFVHAGGPGASPPSAGGAAPGSGALPTVGRFGNILVTATGREAKVVPTGDYEVYVSRGTEYDLVRKRVTVHKGRPARLRAELSRTVDTTGFVSADFHMHLIPAKPGGSPSSVLRDGALTVAGEGLELMTATDHNQLKDYAPMLRELGLDRFVKSLVGIEIDTAFGHFNSFPASVNRWQDRTFRKAIRTPAEFLRLARENPGDEIVQINHPRKNEPDPGDGYFDGRLNRVTGEIEYPFFETGFDLVEIMNAGNDGAGDLRGRTEIVSQKLKDWFGLLNRGITLTGVGNSDAHRYPAHLPGYPRNYVPVGTENPWEIEGSEVVNALKRGATTTSFGPFIRFTANDAVPVGSRITDTDGSVALRIRVQAAAHVPVDRVELIANGTLLQDFDVAAASGVTRFAKDLVVRPGRDTWYLVVASSDRRWDAPFSNFTSFAFTNPIFIDVDGNGYFDPPHPGYPRRPHEKGSP